MIFGVLVALPKHILSAKYHVKIYVYSDVTTFYNSLISFYVFSGLPTEWPLFPPISMKFSTHVALPKHNIHVKYLPKIYVYSDVTAFCDSSLFIFKVFC